MAVFDLPSQKAAWKPLRLVEAGDTPYGKLQVIRNEEQVTVFDNGLAVFSHPDDGAAEESVHFALLQRDGPRRVLLIGGGASGGAAEALKYPDIHVDCVELDPAIIRLADKHLPGPVRTALDDPRTRVIFRDGRTFVGRTEDRYDAILLNLPEPATAQINRYYTREFFLQVRSRLSPGGVFSFVVPSAENYISRCRWPNSWALSRPRSGASSPTFSPSPAAIASSWPPTLPSRSTRGSCRMPSPGSAWISGTSARACSRPASIRPASTTWPASCPLRTRGSTGTSSR